MDVHIVPGVKAKDVAEAHRLDLMHQNEHGCNCMTYWIDEARESIFCLIEANTQQDVINMHQKAHGLVPNKVIEVSSDLVNAFLGRIYDPADAPIDKKGLKVFADPSFRILLITSITDNVLLKHQWGASKTSELLDDYHRIIRKNIQQYSGQEAAYIGNSFVISFASAADAATCALAIKNEMPTILAGKLNYKAALNAGEPIEQSNELFGDTIQYALNLCSISPAEKIALAFPVKQLLPEELFRKEKKHFQPILTKDEELLKLLFNQLTESWQDIHFDMTNYSKALAMSSAQLYRKSVSLTGLSPNALLKAYRLQKAKELMKKQHLNIAQVTFEAGFSSPSYFTKCFKKEFGLLPMAYLDLLE